jgi:hypothetical protein
MPDVRDTQPEYRGVCRPFKFKSVGWKNISVGGVMLCVVGWLLLIIGSIKKEEELWIEVPLGKLYTFISRDMVPWLVGRWNGTKG